MCFSTRSARDSGLTAAFALGVGTAPGGGVWVWAIAPAGSATAGSRSQVARAAEQRVDLMSMLYLRGMFAIWSVSSQSTPVAAVHNNPVAVGRSTLAAVAGRPAVTTQA